MRRATLALAAILLLPAGCGDQKRDSRDSSGGDIAAASTSTTEQTPPQGAAGCRSVDAPAAKPDGGQKKPTGKLDDSAAYRLRVATSCGAFTIELDQDQSPNASASLVALAQRRFFDRTVFHRIAPGFVIQGGDPTGTGTGGPGYSTRDDPPSDATYTKGVVAMAKTQAEPPGTAGSQFYVVTGESSSLPPDYAVVGKVVAGESVVDRIGELGGPDEKPTQPVVIDSVRVQKG